MKTFGNSGFLLNISFWYTNYHQIPNLNLYFNCYYSKSRTFFKVCAKFSSASKKIPFRFSLAKYIRVILTYRPKNVIRNLLPFLFLVTRPLQSKYQNLVPFFNFSCWDFKSKFYTLFQPMNWIEWSVLPSLCVTWLALSSANLCLKLKFCAFSK